MSRICEEFSIAPSQGARELGWAIDDEYLRDVVLDIMELRAYARTYRQIEDAKDAASMPKGAMADLVLDVEYALFHERKAELEQDG